MADQRKSERDDPQRTTPDDERLRGIGDPDDDAFEDEDDLDEEESEEDEESI